MLILSASQHPLGLRRLPVPGFCNRLSDTQCGRASAIGLSIPPPALSLFALYFMVELYLHAHGSPRGTSPVQSSPSQWGVPKCCSGPALLVRQQLHLELATVARPQVRALARFNYLPLVFVLAFAPFQQLLLLCLLCGSAVVPPCLPAWLVWFVCLFACLSVCLFVCPSVCQADCILRP